MFIFEYVEMIGVLFAGGFLWVMWWRDPYRKQAKKIMKSCKRKPNHFDTMHGHHHSH